ncbi:tRNA dihydrouridine synthase DusB [Acidiferrimicrobium sp. IK]|uniref:tRNA dihydrouridine synthase DusB n=1 Tax=Acidiferrimicrobium sp. IK TaxID=2871700 RepID=UPI0021CAF1DA|nr:tRNA dihydrouridine synthase DusB [Acidiferrimicrobium sp. IK]
MTGTAAATGTAATTGRALQIGPLPVEPPVVLAPMAGVTNAAFRQLCRRYGGGLYVSEMITARALVEGNERTLRMLAPAPGEQVRSAQLYGVDPAVMTSAVRRLVDDIGVDHVDLNFGCPAAKVTRKGGGAALPLHRVLFRNVVRAAVRAAGRVPVTVKMRIGLDDAHRTAIEAGLTAEEEGVAAVALHARTAYQHYAGTADWEAIGELKAAISTIPVLGNGDIWEAGDALAMMAATGCDGVVVGRGCLGRPWLFADLDAVFAGGQPAPPRRFGEVTAVMAEHARLLGEHLGPDRGIRDFRKHVGWYLTGFPVGAALRGALARITTLEEMGRLLAGVDPDLELPPGAQRLARGHTNGPRPVALPAGWLDTLDDPSPPAGADTLVSGG